MECSTVTTYESAIVGDSDTNNSDPQLMKRQKKRISGYFTFSGVFGPHCSRSPMTFILLYFLANSNGVFPPYRYTKVKK